MCILIQNGAKDKDPDNLALLLWSYKAQKLLTNISSRSSLPVLGNRHTYRVDTVEPLYLDFFYPGTFVV